MTPSRLKLTTTVMSTGLAAESGGGFQQERSLTNISLRLSSAGGSARASPVHASHSSTAANQASGLLRRVATASLDVGCDLHLYHLVGVGDLPARRAWGRLLELVDHIHAGHDLADHGVLAVQTRAVGEHDEELRVRGIDAVAAAGHADDAALERDVGKFLLQVRILRAAGAVEILAVSGLRHEAVHYPVERHVVVVAFARELLDALGMLGRQIG